jgi:predicted ATPase
MTWESPIQKYKRRKQGTKIEHDTLEQEAISYCERKFNKTKATEASKMTERLTKCRKTVPSETVTIENDGDKSVWMQGDWGWQSTHDALT